MTPWALRLDLSTALKEKSKSVRKLSILSLYTRLMSSTHVLRASWLYFQARQEKSPKKLGSKSTRKYQNGVRKVKPRSCLEYFSLMRFICSIWNVSLSSTEHLKARQLPSSSSPLTEVSLISEVLTTRGKAFMT